MTLPAATFKQRVRLRLSHLLDRLTHGLVERDTPVRLAVLAALAGEHVVLVGPPGTAKSQIARRLRLAFRDASFFERLMTRFSVPEELFGPLSLKGLERDEYTRLTEGFLPTASVAFLDEVFKVNSAILNALLGILNEREFDNGRERVRVPLVAAVGASNEIPTDQELLALYDRFLVRCLLEPVSSVGFAELLGLRENSVPDCSDLQLSLRHLERIRAEASKLPICSGVMSALHALRRWLGQKEIYVSDRRWLKIINLLRVAAYTEGRCMVLWPDCWIIQHCLWSQPHQYAEVRGWFENHLVELVDHEPGRYERLVAEKKIATELELSVRRPTVGRSSGLKSFDDGDMISHGVGAYVCTSETSELTGSAGRPGTRAHRRRLDSSA